MTVRVLSSPEIEKYALSSATYSKENLLELVQNLNVLDFTEVIHKEIFFLLKDVYLATEEIGQVVICQIAKDKGYLERIGGLQNLLSILTSSYTGSDIKSFIEYLKEQTALRDIKNLSLQSIDSLDNGSINSIDLIEKMRDSLNKISCRTSKSDLIKLDEAFKSGFDGKSCSEKIIEVQENRKSGISIVGLETGFPALDKTISGLEGGNLVLLAARPGMGKTTLAINMFCHTIYKQKLPALFVSMEMNQTDLMHKITSSMLNIDYTKIRESTISSEEYQDIVVFEKSEHLGILTFGKYHTINELRSSCIRSKEAFDIKLIIIDYVQLLSNGKKQSDNRNQEISEISRSLKLLSGTLNVPIICLSQLSRDIDKRQNPIPLLSDLRDSGALEADADIVLFVHRDDYKDKFAKPGHAKIIVAKNRRGSICEIPISHNLGMSKFVPSVE